MIENKKPNLFYIFPNLFTATSAFVGMLSIFASTKGNFEKAILYIVLSLILDGFDGRVARLTNTTSKFGVEFDSLADIIAFGVAPAVLFYYGLGIHYGKVGSLIAGVFAVFGAIRLARFNVTTGTYDPSVFIGLPIPTAAVTAAFWIGLYKDYPKFFAGYEGYIMALMGILSLLMVSNVRFPSFKKIDFKKANFLKVLVFIIILLSMFYLYPYFCVIILTSLYLIYGISRAIYTIAIAKYLKMFR